MLLGLVATLGACDSSDEASANDHGVAGAGRGATSAGGTSGVASGGTSGAASGGTSGAASGGTSGVASGGTSSAGSSGSGGSGNAGAAGSSSGGAGGAPQAASVSVHLVPNGGSGNQRVNFTVPFAQGRLTDEKAIRVLRAGQELAIARRTLAKHRDGSIRSLQVQVELSISGELDLEVRIGEAGTQADLALQPVVGTLQPADGTNGPRVWALLPAEWLSASGIAGPQLPEAGLAGTPHAAWQEVCDYTRFDADSFASQISDASVWLFDRGTALYRGYARRGDLVTASSAYRETSIYRNGITGTGGSARIGIPGKADDLKYYYSQNLALHYLMTGDERFRESAEDMATRAAALWTSPGYAGGADFWTERNAGFGLLAYVWAMIVSDDRSAQYRTLADAAVDAYIQLQNTYPAGYSDTAARCFAHHADAHGEGYGYFGCSPWMSAILVDGLDAYAAESDATRAAAARASIVKLGRILARQGRDPSGRPYYWMGVGVAQNEVDDYDEHWGESAYIVAAAWHHAGRNDAALRKAADELVAGFGTNGTAPHMRSFNWQCRSAIATPWYLR